MGWDVYHNGKLIDTVWYSEYLSADYVRDSLINHDGYPSDIVIRRK